MTERVLGPTGSPRRRRSLLLSLIAALAVGLFFVAGAQAVHDETFQLDGNTALGNNTNLGGNIQSLDWASLFDASGNELTLPTGFDATSFKKDFLNNGSSFVTSDTTTFATGSKDTLPISGWQCNFDNNVNSKIDVTNAYAASYTDPTGDEILYFGLERNSNSGTANVGFWFLQANVGCSSTGGAVSFTGEHMDGDLLVVSEFTGGGTVSTINVYRWNRPGNPAGVPGSLGTTPVATGADCRGLTVPIDDDACGAANTGTITVPWASAVKASGPTEVTSTLPTALFFEGGVNLTDSQLGGKCFNTFLADTRSSAELTATLFDFAGGTLGQCTSTTVTTPSIAAPTQIPANGTLTVSDSALITVTGATSFSGSLTFHLCGPAATQTLCSSGGVAVGSAQTITANGTYNSANATVTSVGHYCWRAEFSGDSSAGVPPSSDARANECFEITPRTPTLSTTAVDGQGNPIGTAAQTLGSTIYDTALLGNTANKPGTGGPAGSNGSINPATAGAAAGGTITFKLYGPDADGVVDQTACTNLPLAAGFPAAGIVVSVSGNGTYGGPTSNPVVGFAPQSPGFYFWKADYSGDAPNTLSATHNANCLASAEKVEILQLQPAISTAQNFVPNDSATITVASGAGDLAGSAVFKLWVDDANCTGTADYTSSAINIATGSGTGLSRTVVSGNTTAYSASATFHWVVEYTTTNTGHKNVTSPCGKEHSSITIQNNGTPNS